MDIHEDIVKWLRTMGYRGEIPETLISICNNSTKFIWEDLVQNVRPRQEVEQIKKNLILNRLKSQHLARHKDFSYTIREIENFQQKQVLEEKLKLLSDMVQEKKHKVEKLSQNCKIKDISIDYLKKKIKENEERKYLLDQKEKQLQVQKSEAEESLTTLKHVTPVEREESNSPKEIMETLEGCAEKLNKILAGNQKQSLAENLQTTTRPTTTCKKNKQDQSSIASYLSIREKEDFEEISRSCKKARGKENRSLNIQDAHGKIESKKRLFEIPQVIVEDSEKLSFENLSLSRISKNDQDEVLEENNQTEINFSFKKPQKKESLGILPSSCFSDKDNDSFLGWSDSISLQNEDDVFEKSSGSSVFSFMSINPRSNDSSESVVFNYNRTNLERKNKSKIVKAEEIFRKEIYSNKCVNKELQVLLHGNNRELIYEVLQKMIQNLKVEFTKTVSVEATINEKKNKINEDDITELQFIHLQTELKIIQQKKNLRDLVARIGERKLQILNAVKCSDPIDIENLLDSNIDQVGLDASLAAMRKEINSSTIMETDENELKLLSSRILKIKNETTNKIKLIQKLIEDLHKVQASLKSTRESVLSPIWHLKMFRSDLDWMNPLLENRWSEEIRIFEHFPLEYQRRCTYTDSKAYYRDLCVDNYPNNAKWEPEELKMLCDVLESPFSPPETILLNMLKAKMKLEVLKKLRSKTIRDVDEQFKQKYSLEELRRQESYLEYAIDRLKAIMYSSNAAKTLAIGDVIKHTMEIWTEMPMKEFISSKRLVEGQDYKFYENKLKTFL